jgi:cytochrome c oxidase cbb3-type subunit II
MKSFASLFFVLLFGISSSTYFLLVRGANHLSPLKLKTSLMVSDEDVTIIGHEGLAGRGQKVYRELGCVVCHTQQTRRPGYGGDFGRDWGSRQSVARDYVLQDQVILGNMRIGPDLSNVGSRHDAAWFFAHLFKPSDVSEVSNMPSYPFLFKEREYSGTPSANALALEGNDTPAEGFEIVPTDDAVALVAYLQSLKMDYDLPESKRIK